MRHFLFLVACLASPVLAEEWTPMTGAEISTVLTDARIEYDGAWQHFYASGRTLYNAGHDSWGYWAVRGDQYCSQWPPGDLWDCYDMARSGDLVRFVGAHGNAVDGVLSK